MSSTGGMPQVYGDYPLALEGPSRTHFVVYFLTYTVTPVIRAVPTEMQTPGFRLPLK